MREDDLLEHIRRAWHALAPAHAGVVVGPGDDCAVVRSAAGESLLLKVDQVVEGRHVEPVAAWSPEAIDLVARTALARPLSDIAAMGGSPRWALAAAILPRGFEGARDLADRLSHWARSWRCPVVGGDVAIWGAEAQAARLAIAVTIVGSPHPSRGPVLRSGARPGDDILITGPVGDSRRSGWSARFEPRLHEAGALCDALGARLHAMIDISDGLGIDAHRLARASGVVVEIAADAIPLRAPGLDPLRAAAEGEDYELLFAAAGAAPMGTVIGRARAPADAEEPGAVIITPSGSRVAAAGLGWDHGVN